MPIDTTSIDSARDNVAAMREELSSANAASLKLGSTLATALEGVIVKGKSATSIVDSLAQSLANAALKSALKPFESAFSDMLGGLFSGMSPFANGGAFQNGMPVPFAAGGVISSPVAFPMGGGQTGLAGERGPEAIMPLTRGPDGKLGIATNGDGPAVTVHFNVTSPDADSFARSETQLAAMLSRTVSLGQRNL